MVKSNVYHKKEWTELDLQKALDQYWALEPKACHQGVSKIAIACGVPHQTLDNRPPQPICPLPSTLIAHVHYLDPPSTQVLSSWGPYQSFIPYQPPQYCKPAAS